MISRLIENLDAVEQRVADAAYRGGRSAGEITLVAVTKYVEAEKVAQLWQAGCRDFGESRPQELWQKAGLLADSPIRWHLIGHLQRNKVERTLPLVTLIHSVDSSRLLREIDKFAPANYRAAVLLEVNISGDAAKHGVMPDDVESLLQVAAQCPRVEVRGLMTMAGLDANHAATRRQFAMLRELRDRLRHSAPPGVSLNELSMGMSDDFDIAIEEGATIVRVGSALFEGVA